MTGTTGMPGTTGMAEMPGPSGIGTGGAIDATTMPPPADPVLEEATDFGAPAGGATGSDSTRTVPPTTATP